MAVRISRTLQQYKRGLSDELRKAKVAVIRSVVKEALFIIRTDMWGA